MKTTHTPGPWAKEGATVCQAETLQTICKTLGKNEEIQSANARLIAAAPDLLSALSAIVADYHALQRTQGASANIGAIGSEFTAGAWVGSRLGGHIAHAESAIAKATA